MLSTKSPLDKVCFRKFPEGDVIALFPEEIFDTEGKQISSYQHIGQHGGASRDLIDDLEKADYEDYRDLKEELESIGYNLDIQP